ncbi:MAG: hypothetical protein AAF085_17010 [Planctomycetota bacterium]
MNDPMIASLRHLLKVSLAEWHLDGDIMSDQSGRTKVQCGDVEMMIERAPQAMPFRWFLSIDGRKRTAASVAGVLRIVRQTLAPGYEPLSLRIAPTPIVPLPLHGRDTS